MKASKTSIRTRILALILTLIGVIFLVVFAVFNALLGEYIKNSVTDQLQGVRQVGIHERGMRLLPLGEPPQGEPRPQDNPDMRRMPRGVFGRTEALIVTEDYELIIPGTNIFVQNTDEMTAIVTQLKVEQVGLQDPEIKQIRAQDREYSFVSIKIPDIFLERLQTTSPAFFVVYYIDMTTLTSLAHRINVVLLGVMGVAGLLAILCAILLSGKLAEPIRELTRFALRIGEGNFAKNTLRYRDKELADLADSMNKAAGQLEAYDKGQKTFFQNASHELRTPLQSIRINAEGIEHDILDRKKASHVIISETDRLSEIVEDLLYLSRIDNITKSNHVEEYDLRELLSNAAERQRMLAAERGLVFEFDFDEQPVFLRCNPKHISRACANLTSNAIRYANKKITLTCHSAHDGILIQVGDDGEGIKNIEPQDVFDRFHKGKGGKHGIGLSIVKSIVDQHNGEIAVLSGDQGAIFTITFK